MLVLFDKRTLKRVCTIVLAFTLLVNAPISGRPNKRGIQQPILKGRPPMSQ